MNDNFINQFGKPRPPSRKFAESLYKRINKPMHTSARTILFRTLTIPLAVMAVLATVLFVSPPARAFADGVIHQFGFFVFVQGEIQPEATKQAPPAAESVDQAAAQAKKESILPGEPDAAAASQVAGFPILAPTYLPEGFTLLSDWRVEKKSDLVQSVDISYQSGENEVLMISQLHSGPDTPPLTITMPEIQDVTVRGQPGVWLPAGKHSLVWVENGITIRIESNALNLEETLKIAESMGK
jgi:hypothetical protein